MASPAAPANPPVATSARTRLGRFRFERNYIHVNGPFGESTYSFGVVNNPTNNCQLATIKSADSLICATEYWMDIGGIPRLPSAHHKRVLKQTAATAFIYNALRRRVSKNIAMLDVTRSFAARLFLLVDKKYIRNTFNYTSTNSSRMTIVLLDMRALSEAYGNLELLALRTGASLSEHYKTYKEAWKELFQQLPKAQRKKALRPAR